MAMSFLNMKFSTLRLSVSDVSESRDWYSNLFGVDPIEDIENFASFKINNIILDICSADEKSPMPRGGAVGYWQVDNLDEAINRSVEMGGTIFRGPLRVEETQKTIVQIKDPFDGIIGFEANF